MSDDHTAADTEALRDGASNMTNIGFEARALMNDFYTAMETYGNVFDGAGDGAGGYRGANGGDYARIWDRSVVPGLKYAEEFFDKLSTALGDVGGQTRGAANALGEADEDAGSAS